MIVIVFSTPFILPLWHKPNYYNSQLTYNPILDNNAFATINWDHISIATLDLPVDFIILTKV